MQCQQAEEGLVVSCGSCFSPGSAALTCRINGGISVAASWEPEQQKLSCVVPKEHCVPSFYYEVVDGAGNVICKSSNCCRDAPGSACAMSDAKTCDEPFLMNGGGSCCGDKGADAAPGAAPTAAAAGAAAGRGVMSGLSWLDRLLPVWIVAAMVMGVLLGSLAPQVRGALAVLHIGNVSLPIALGLWLMMWPVLTKVRYELLGSLLTSKGALKQFGLSFVLNWVLGPALMTALAWACLPDLPGFRNGVIMVGLARCIAMVLIWNELARGSAELCAVMVAFNSVLQIVLYAPLSLFYLQVVSGGAAVHVGFWPVAKSVLLFLGIPLVAGVLLRYGLIAVKSREWLDKRFMPWFGPCALLGLLYTIVVMFASQDIISQIGNVARVAVPMLVYFMVMFFASFALSHWCKMSYESAVTQAFTAASNNFELAIAVAVGVFGINSQEALAATVGPLIEVPVLLGLVYVALWLKPRVWEKAGSRAAHSM
uniref:Arsenical-resistance protein n=1 Tax=Tetradesmus obliquus TaxID=3088 RepID=A0A383W304_TETOB|eukprot:jgi/Sobl393_1/5221/SZX71590.1